LAEASHLESADSRHSDVEMSTAMGAGTDKKATMVGKVILYIYI